MDPQDIADKYNPLPLLLVSKWNHYIGFYYQYIRDFFMAFAPFPFENDHFHLTCLENQTFIDPTSIVSHLVTRYTPTAD